MLCAPALCQDANFSFYENLERDFCVKLVRAIFACQPMIYGGQVGEFCLPVPCSNPSDLTTRRQHLQARYNCTTSVPGSSCPGNLSTSSCKTTLQWCRSDLGSMPLPGSLSVL